MWFDNLAIPKDAHERRRGARLHRLPAAARGGGEEHAISSAYANGNLASQKLIDKAVLDDRTVYPDAATMASLYTITARDQRDAAADQPAVDQDQDRTMSGRRLDP